MKKWKAPVSEPSNVMARKVLRVLKELDYEFRRDKTYQNYTRFHVILPIPEAAYTFRFYVTKPSEMIIDVYDTRPSHSGTLHFIYLQMIEDPQDAKRFLRRLVRIMRRKPWEFRWGERVRTGIILPEYMGAKKKWKRAIGPDLKGKRGQPPTRAG